MEIDNNLIDEFREKLISTRWELHPEVIEYEESQGSRCLDDYQVDDIYDWVVELIKSH